MTKALEVAYLFAVGIEECTQINNVRVAHQSHDLQLSILEADVERLRKDSH